MKEENALKQILANESEKYFNVLFEEEGITKEDLEMVDLNIRFSPVLISKDSRPVEVTKTIGGDYIVPGYPINPVPAEILKVMRYRYLTSNLR